jgi:16S rRNA processing protein RimM
MRARDKLIYLGVAIGAHGLQGFVKIKSLASDPQSIAKLPLQDEHGAVVPLKIIRTTKDCLICSVVGISDRNAADGFRGTKLYTNRLALPEPDDSEYYVEDLKGLEVRSLEGDTIGNVIAAHNFGAGDLLEIGFLDGNNEIYPFTNEVFPALTGEYIILKEPDLLKVHNKESPSSTG